MKAVRLPTASEVLITYAADTQPLAEKLTRALQKEGINPWADFKDLQPGQYWKDELQKAVGRAKSFLFIVSPASQATTWTDWEWRAALEETWAHSDKKLVPLVVGADNPPPFLRNWVPLRINPSARPSTWAKLVKTALAIPPQNARQELPNRDRKARQKRLNELATAAQRIVTFEKQTPPDRIG